MLEKQKMEGGRNGWARRNFKGEEILNDLLSSYKK